MEGVLRGALRRCRLAGMKPTIGRMVIYRSRTGAYSCPATITATVDTLNAAGVEAGYVPALTDEDHVHLTVFTPGTPGKRGSAKDFVGRPDAPISENVAGCYQEWDVPFFDLEPVGTGPVPLDGEYEQLAGSWAWPPRA